MGKKIVLTGVTLTDLDAPKLARVDPIESSGSLLLIEPGNPLTGSLGALANGLTVPNLFAANAAAIVGGASSEMHGALYVSSGLSGKLLLERTGKGGIHGLVTQVDGQITSGLGVSLNPSAAFRAYTGFAKGTGHQFYVSMWTRPTRLAAARDVIDFQFGAPANDFMFFRTRKSGIASGTPETGQTILLNTFGSVPLTLANTRRTVRFDASAWKSTGTPGMLGGFWGSPSGSYTEASPADRDDAPSFAFYRMYIEDLTLSGRTFAELETLDQALHAAAFAAGGRYHGDTYTDPATLP